VDKQELTEVLSEVLDKHSKIDQEVHTDHHEFIEMLQKREKRRIELWQKFKLSAVGTIATALVGALIWIGKLVLDHT